MKKDIARQIVNELMDIVFSTKTSIDQQAEYIVKYFTKYKKHIKDKETFLDPECVVWVIEDIRYNYGQGEAMFTDANPFYKEANIIAGIKYDRFIKNMAWVQKIKPKNKMDVTINIDTKDLNESIEKVTKKILEDVKNQRPTGFTKLPLQKNIFFDPEKEKKGIENIRNAFSELNNHISKGNSIESFFIWVDPAKEGGDKTDYQVHFLGDFRRAGKFTKWKKIKSIFLK